MAPPPRRVRQRRSRQAVGCRPSARSRATGRA
jgi:hypothetical protein